MVASAKPSGLASHRLESIWREPTMPPLTTTEIDDLLNSYPGWKFEDGKLIRDWTFKDFVEAMAFVNQVAELAEAAGHHPDIDIRYNHVRLGLVSHDAGGITSRDAAMAAQISKRFSSASKF
jgi:4a-hydroxytetrahydrobiopterin dehydratase